MVEEKPKDSNDDDSTSNEDGANTDASSDMKEEKEAAVASKNDDDDKEDEEEEDEEEEEEEDPPKKKVELTEEQKKEYLNWPLHEIKEPHEHDVLYGRGGGTNHHPGNKHYRRMVEDRKLDYVNSKRLDKPLVALEIIKTWRGQTPPGRFLKMDDKTGLWLDVGDKKAREKTSQALREKAPEIRRKQEEEEMIKAGKDPDKEREVNNKKNTRFAEGTKDRQRDAMKHAVLARDHSLGREYLNPGESVALDGFSWNPASLDRIPSYGSVSAPPLPGGGPYPPGRITSHGSHGAIPPHFPPSRTGSHNSSMGGPPPPPADYYRTMSQEERQRSFGSGPVRYDSWSRLPSGGSVPPPPMPPYGGGSPYQQHRSGSFGMPPPVGGPPPPMARDHSLSHNPLRDASIGHPASRAAFEAQRSNSGYWGDPNMPPPGHGGMSGYGGPPPPQYMSGPGPSGDYGRTPSGGPSGDYGRTPSGGPSGDYGRTPSGGPSGDYGRTPSGGPSGDYGRTPSGGPSGDYGRTPSGDFGGAPSADFGRAPSSGAVYDPNRPPLPSSSPGSPPAYQVDPAIAKTWSTQSEDYEKAATMFGPLDSGRGNLQMNQSWSPTNDNRQQVKPGTFHEHAPLNDTMPRPDMVKRMTSNQNEDFETKPDFTGEGRSIKRAALNRDNSMVSNRLKAEYAPGALKRPIPLDKDMRMLSASMEQSSLGGARPKSLSTEERISTMDKIAMELMVKPSPMLGDARSSTIEALALDLDLDVDTVDLKGEVDLDLLTPEEMAEADLPRPPSLRTEGRLSTAEYLDIVNEPLGLDEAERALDLNREASVSEWLQQG